MPRSQLLYLTDIADAAGNIRTYVGSMTFEEFQNDRLRIDAVVRNFEIIGEAVKNLSDSSKKGFPPAEWKAIAGFRDMLIHGYFGIDLEILWDIIQHKLPVLSHEIEVMIERETAQKE